jgi:hypothetical protein
MGQKNRPYSPKEAQLIYIDEPMVKEFIYNFRHVDQYIKLNGKHFNLGEGVVQVFKLPWERIVAKKEKRVQLNYYSLFHKNKA